GGPHTRRMTLRRLSADGSRPDAVVFEYWPPFMSYDVWPEFPRVSPERLFRHDLPLVRDYFPSADARRVEKLARRGRLNPLYTLRQRILIQVFPAWFPWPSRFDVAWDGLDPRGWLPGLKLEPGPTEERSRRLAQCIDLYGPGFRKYKIHPQADRALREAVALARANGARVTLCVLPEAGEFRAIYTPRTEQIAADYLAGLVREFGVPVIDARLWMDDGLLVDGFHLSRIGAAEFTRKFAPAVAATFAE